jgi:purine nucleosidase
VDDRIPVLFDTDIGSNLDDALALAFLLRNPQCRLLGITTVSGPVERRAACAAAICRAAGRDDVPIHCGASSPLLFGPGQPDVPHYFALSDDERAAGTALAAEIGPQPTAVHFLRHAIRGTPQPVMLLSTGPLTNIALLFATDPEIPALLRGFVSMAGSFDPHREGTETNCRIDPVAASVVFEQWRRAAGSNGARLKPSTSIGLDVTLRCAVPAADLRKKLTGPGVLDAVGRMGDAWLRTRQQVCLHDPLAAACVFRPALCGYAPGIVTVDATPGSPTAGATRFAPSPAGAHRIATSVNGAVFGREFFGVF